MSDIPNIRNLGELNKLLIPQTYYVVANVMDWNSITVEITDKRGDFIDVPLLDLMGANSPGFGYCPVFKTKLEAEAYIREFCGGEAEVFQVASMK